MKKQNKKAEPTKPVKPAENPSAKSTKPVRKPKNTSPDMRSTPDGKYDGGGYDAGDEVW
ncbi:MAG TPA: hypothetical protein VEY71_07170 [Chitinophagales bacterium]|nr:hypothetical protein [Chitinophagales bacterium]